MIAALHHAPSSRLLPYLVGVIVIVGLVLIVIDRRGGAKSNHVDAAARNLPQDRSVRRYTDPKHAPAALRHLQPGPAIGKSVVSGKMIRAAWEDVVVVVSGARSGKTTSLAIPSILSAPGPVYATSNKGDLLAATRGFREKLGTVWAFDPQGLVGEKPSWWYNPLSAAGTITGARQLAGLFATATRPLGSTTDAFFDGAGEEFLALLLLAAALGDRPITDVYAWCSNPNRAARAVTILGEHGHPMAAQGVQGVIDQPDRQRAGVTSTASKAVAWLADPSLAVWCTDQGDNRPRFDVDQFLNSSSTLYSLSREGPESAGPLTAALTAAVIGAAEHKASRSPAGRLPVPLLACLDEAANVVRWSELPDLCSHSGSKGIVPMIFLQSWAQATQVWGRDGAMKLFSSANVRVVGPGVSDADFLADVSQILGDHQAPHTSRSYQSNGRSTTTTVRSERTFDVAALAALPPGRAVVMLSGARPVLVRTQSAHDGPHAAEIRASIGKYGSQ